MLYDDLALDADRYGIDIYEKPLPMRLKGLYGDRTIWINRHLSRTEKACILAEELGHFHTSAGDIIDQSGINNRKQELRARQWAYDRLVPLSKIVQAYRDCIPGHELAEYLGVTEEFLRAAVRRYQQKYGLYAVYEQYIIYFEPLMVVDRFKLNKTPAD